MNHIKFFQNRLFFYSIAIILVFSIFYPPLSVFAQEMATPTPGGNGTDEFSSGIIYTEGQCGKEIPWGATEECRDVNYLLMQIIRIGKFLFSIIGSLAFLMLVYGGFTFILSMGNAEKAKKGMDIALAAVVGMFIAFSAYILVDFLLDALNVSEDFRVIK